jgi:hypothetical protein
MSVVFFHHPRVSMSKLPGDDPHQYPAHGAPYCGRRVQQGAFARCLCSNTILIGPMTSTLAWKTMRLMRRATPACRVHRPRRALNSSSP